MNVEVPDNIAKLQRAFAVYSAPAENDINDETEGVPETSNDTTGYLGFCSDIDNV
ncbi:MAG: hypothetical protein ABF290_06025 [Thiogranum sp.]